VRSPLAQSDTGKDTLITPEKMAALLRASGGASPDPEEGEWDPELQAQVDDEVEQFRRRLEAASSGIGGRVRLFAL